jgi:hypothetical protein
VLGDGARDRGAAVTASPSPTRCRLRRPDGIPEPVRSGSPTSPTPHRPLMTTTPARRCTHDHRERLPLRGLRRVRWAIRATLTLGSPRPWREHPARPRQPDLPVHRPLATPGPAAHRGTHLPGTGIPPVPQRRAPARHGVDRRDRGLGVLLAHGRRRRPLRRNRRLPVPDAHLRRRPRRGRLRVVGGAGRTHPRRGTATDPPNSAPSAEHRPRWTVHTGRYRSRP